MQKKEEYKLDNEIKDFKYKIKDLEGEIYELKLKHQEIVN
jgi:hypothetical protein